MNPRTARQPLPSRGARVDKILRECEARHLSEVFKLNQIVKAKFRPLENGGTEQAAEEVPVSVLLTEMPSPHYVPDGAPELKQYELLIFGEADPPVHHVFILDKDHLVGQTHVTLTKEMTGYPCVLTPDERVA
jgi:hypothetical protein